MIDLPINAETRELARRLIWFEPAEQALAEPIRFLAYAFRFGRAADMGLLRSLLGDEQLRHALRNAPPGIIDPRSWAYWHLMLELEPAPMPQRELGVAARNLPSG